MSSSNTPTIHTYPNSFRTAKAQIVAEYTGQEVHVPSDFKMGETNKSADFLARHPAGTVPAMDHGDVSLTDSAAIAHYVALLKDTAHVILGNSIAETAAITQWLIFAAANIETPAMAWLFPVWGYTPLNKPVYTWGQEGVKKALATLDRHLLTRTYLVGEYITLADITVACSLRPLFNSVLSPEWRKDCKNVVRWYVTCMNQPNFKKVFGECVLAAEEAKPAAPKKEEKKPKDAKPVAAAPKKEEAAAEEDLAEEKPKAKSALDLLPPTSFNLEDWKRFYSNNDTKPTAMDYFWQHYDPSGFSIWRVDYKYNDELKLTFMSSNLIGGFYNRMERAKKYGFGSLCVLGENNNNSISGYMVLRGDVVPFEVTDAADYESYNFVKVDPTDPKTKELIADYFAWEETIEGKPFAAGKIFK